MLIIQVCLSFVGMTGIYPIEISIAGISTQDFLEDMTTDLSNLVYNITHPGVIEYISAFYLVILLAIKVVLSFMVFVFYGFGMIFAAIGFPSYIYLPLQLIVDAVVLYDFAQSKM
jgi:hypothetical protein